MICRNCQAEVQDFPFCPQCGHRLQEIPLGKPGRRTRRRLFFRRWVFPLSLLLAVIAFGVLALALRGFQDGIQDRDLANHRQAEILYNRGLVYLELGQPQLAEAHFEETLRLAPDYVEAQEKLLVARAKQTVTPSPTLPPPTPTPVTPTPTPEIVVVPLTDVLYEEGKAHYEAQEWELVISKLEQLRLEDINYKSEQVTEMLFESHKAYGQALDEEGQIEAAILQYDHALDLRPRNPEVSELRRQADLYQSALSDWGVDWESVINFLIALYHVSPEYKDATDRLYEACITYGEEMVKQERYCTASEYFEQAVEIRDDDEYVVKREGDTSILCAAKPELMETPMAPITASVWSKVHIGTLVATCYEPHDNRYDICAQNAEDNVLETWIRHAEQPAITLDGSWLAYRSADHQRPGLYAMDVISGTVVTITVDANAHHPTWSPDGTHLAYTQYDEEQADWFIYIAQVGADKPPQQIRKGEWPSWGPGGFLAFTTCGQENDCGIYVYDPSTGALRKVTASKQDRAAAWSPSGDEIAYTSDIGLSFNLHIVNIKIADTWGRQITKNLFTDVMPVWSPDGQRIAFITNHNDDWSVYSIHPYPGVQAEHIVSLGAESADWQRIRLAWTAPIVRFPNGDQ
jgi:tetratricopeptide (TPR) repeat protein